jgi:hypothetical protein
MKTDTHNDVVFVYGALRSGTTVFRLMLNAHSRIANPGEMDFLFDVLSKDSTHPTGWRYNIARLQENRIFRAKNLDIPAGCDGLDLLDAFLSQLKSRSPGKVLSINVHRHADTLLAVMPHVRIIHMLRDPRDVAQSSIAMGWAGTLYHGVGHWLGTETAWDAATASTDPAQILQITYESLFRDIETTLALVCGFMRVPYDPAMLRYHENTTYGPPDASLTEQWRQKCSPQELMDIEDRAGAMMLKRSYALAHPRTGLNPGRRIKLAVINKTRVWTFGMRRFGAGTYWAEKATRWARLRILHRPIKRRMDRITVQHLK